jgi:predicted ATPase/class 3 adenylate cyclase
MARLPTGTVTFLFTDIEGSTRLLQELGTDRFERLQDDHATIVHGAITDGGGTVVRIEGDAFFAAFPSPSGALRAVVSAQRDLAAHPWPEDAVIRVRMGLHSGEGRLGGGDYAGIDPNRAARIAAAGHGGQVLLSEATRGLVEHDLPDGVTVRDLGPHRLKDIAHPERLFDLVIEGLASDFPALKTLDARPNNLPLKLTSFVGREAEIAETIRLLSDHRLVTLTGTGGTGKTRLALAAGAEVLSSFQDGVFLVELASLVDSGQVCPAICQVLGVREEPGRDVIDTMVNGLTGQDLLLILDNFEHLLDAAPLVGEVLGRVGEVRVLVTSRAPLGLYGEQEQPIPPLSLPDPGEISDIGALSGYEAVVLFVDRAREARPGFEVSDENATALAEICTRLDGLPLAIELAAGRIDVLSPQAILSRLGHRLDLLTTGARNVPQRQRTLRGGLDWSYDLLEKPERRLFARLSVFVGGADLDAAEAVCNADGDLELPTLDGLASLVGRGLVRRIEAGSVEPRFGMLETIREYAGERLGGDWDREETRRRHGDYFLRRAQESEPEITGEEQAGLLWLDGEHDNVLTAMRWAVEAGHADVGIEAAASIWRYWLLRGHLNLGRALVDRLLEAHPARDAVRARGHGAAGSLAYWSGDVAATERHYGEALTIGRELDDRAGIARALYNIAFLPYLRRGGYAEALPLLREAVDLFQEVGDEESAGRARADIPYFMMLAGQLEDAIPLLKEALTEAREKGDLFRLMDSFFRLAEARREAGDLRAARQTAREALDVVNRWQIEGGVAAILQLLASIETSGGEHARALKLQGAAASIADPLGSGGFPAVGGDFLQRSREAIGEETAERALAEGRAMTRDEALAFARKPDA